MFRAVGGADHPLSAVGLGPAQRLDHFLCGLVIYRHLPIDALWVVGLLVGLEMLFNGWTWIMLAMELRRLPEEARP